jgi:hypothetical protein
MSFYDLGQADRIPDFKSRDHFLMLRDRFGPILFALVPDEAHPLQASLQHTVGKDQRLIVGKRYDSRVNALV